MSQTVVLDDIVKVTWVATFQDQCALPGIYYRVTGVTGLSVTLDEIAHAMSDLAAAHYIALLPSIAKFNGVMVTLPFIIPPPAFGKWTGAAAIGGRGNLILSTQVCSLITTRTNFAGRRYRGRMYIPFPDQFSIDADGKPEAAYLADVETFAGDIVNADTVVGVGGSATIFPVVVHRDLGTSTFINDHITRGKWATQRRRGEYGRPNASPL